MKDKTNSEVIIDRELDKLDAGVSDNKEIDVDGAWNKVLLGMNETATVLPLNPVRQLFIRSRLLKIAAAALVFAGLGVAALYVGTSDSSARQIIASTGDDQKNQVVSLPDGSLITMNRNTTLSYKPGFGKRNRHVSLTGEAFFEIAPDKTKPFIIDAGKAKVTVTGTSFNVITDNINSAVEVFVTSGTVVLTDNGGARDLTLEPGYIGTMDLNHAEKNLNRDPNYMSWNTGKLDYDGQSLDVVFRDLKRVYNMDIKTDDQSILSNKWTSPIDIQSRDTIIRLICTSFNLSYIKDGNVYLLSKK